jgi:hypothetical protein
MPAGAVADRRGDRFDHLVIRLDAGLEVEALDLEDLVASMSLSI